MRYHVHVVDSGAAAATVNAATLFSHLTLRCGHLRPHVMVSASTTRESAPCDEEQTACDDVAAPTVIDQEGTSGGDDKEGQIVKAMERLVRGGNSEANDEEGAQSELRLPYVSEAAPHDIVPYKYFDTPFALAERSLCDAASTTTAACALPYFDLIVAADVTAYDAILTYYAQLPYALSGQGHVHAPPLRKTLAVVHVVSPEPVRASCLVQRFLEMLFMLPQADKNNNNNGTALAQDESHNHDGDAREKEGYGEWLDRVDEVTAYFAQALGIDVLVASV